MKVILSPAKNMKKIKYNGITLNKPVLFDKTNILLQDLKTIPPYELEKILKINPEIAMKVFTYFQDFESKKDFYPAIFSYSGLAFQNIDVQNLNEQELFYADRNIRILSAFYGILKPFDAILPYRLDMNVKYKINGESLYKFWGESIYEELFRENETVLNLASNEFSKMITPYLSKNNTFINCEFLIFKDSKYKILATFAKMCRGAMVKFICKNKINNLKDLKDFSFMSYEYSDFLSDESKIVFINKG